MPLQQEPLTKSKADGPLLSIRFFMGITQRALSCTVEELLPVFVSGELALTVAVFVMKPATFVTVTTKVTVTV